jgi:hypothetical protein
MADLEQEVPIQSQAFWLQGFLSGKLSIPKMNEEIDET